MAEQKHPPVDKWYPLSLGPSCSEDAANRFYSLRYEFKPASIDTSRAGSLHTSAENLATVEFHNNQAGKPKVGFSGNVSDVSDMEMMVFFDGEKFRMERMHRSVKSLRHIRPPEERSAAANAAAAKETEQEVSPTHVNGNSERIAPAIPGAVPEKTKKGSLVRNEKSETEMAPVSVPKSNQAAVAPPLQQDNPHRGREENKKPGKRKGAAKPASPHVVKKREREPSPVNIDIEDAEASPEKKAAVEDEQIEVEEVVEEIEEEVSDYEEVDISEDEDVEKIGVDQTAATLRAQAAAGQSETKASSSSDSSGSGSSESGSGSSESESGSDEEDSASSADDGVDI